MQQPASVAFLPIIPEQNESIKVLKSSFSQQQEQLAERIAEYVGIPFSTELDAPTVDMGWLGGAFFLQLFLCKNALNRPLKLKGFNIQLPISTETLF